MRLEEGNISTLSWDDGIGNLPSFPGWERLDKNYTEVWNVVELEEQQEMIPLMDPNTIVLVIFFILLIIVTMVGNLLVCLSVILVRKLRKPQNYLLMSLALSDLFVAMFVMPFAIVFEIYGGNWPLNRSLCDLWVSADVLCCTASILNLCAISCDRYRAITSPLEYSAKTTPRRILGMIFLVWLISACVSLPPVLLLGNVYKDFHGQPFCSVSQNFWYQIYATMASFYVPLVVMVIVYFKILGVVRDKNKQMSWNKEQNADVHRASSTTTSTIHSADQAQALGFLKKDSVVSTNSHYVGRSSGTPLLTVTAQEKDNNNDGFGQQQATVVTLGNGDKIVTTLNKTGIGRGLVGVHIFPLSALQRLKNRKLFGGLKEHKASTVLGIIMSAFVICWLPFFILAIMRPFLAIQNIEIPPWISSLFNWLGYFNSGLNPLIYATLNRDFRRPFKEILCLRCRTLDSMMRREFYYQQYGDNEENIQRRKSKQPITFF